MKKLISYSLLLAITFASFGQQDNLLSIPPEKDHVQTCKYGFDPVIHKNIAPVQNLFIITLDGLRWQELFNGADAAFSLAKT